MAEFRTRKDQPDGRGQRHANIVGTGAATGELGLSLARPPTAARRPGGPPVAPPGGLQRLPALTPEAEPFCQGRQERRLNPDPEVANAN